MDLLNWKEEGLIPKLAALGQLAAGLAHEIKNPLAAIKGMTQALEQNPRDRRLQKKFREVVPQEVDRLVNLVEELICLGRPPRQQPAWICLNILLEQVMTLFADQCRCRQIKVIKLMAPLPKIWAKPDQLIQVLTNLIINAIQAMSHGGRLIVATQVVTKMVQLEIADSGEGIPAKQLPNIFQPFFSTKETGLGLGLAISYQIIKEHRGELEVESREGEGTTFRLRLPQTKVAEDTISA